MPLSRLPNTRAQLVTRTPAFSVLPLLTTRSHGALWGWSVIGRGLCERLPDERRQAIPSTWRASDFVKKPTEWAPKFKSRTNLSCGKLSEYRWPIPFSCREQGDMWSVVWQCAFQKGSFRPVSSTALNQATISWALGKIWGVGPLGNLHPHTFSDPFSQTTPYFRGNLIHPWAKQMLNP